MQNITDVDLIKLKAEAVDTGHLKLATWGTKEQLIHVLIYGFKDQYRSNYENV
jgi:hypothetical protein